MDLQNTNSLCKFLNELEFGDKDKICYLFYEITSLGVLRIQSWLFNFWPKYKYTVQQWCLYDE